MSEFLAKVFGLSLVLLGLTCVFCFENSAIGSAPVLRILHWPAIVLTGVGPIGLLLLCADFRRIRRAWRLLVRKSPASRERQAAQEIRMFEELMPLFYARGAGALEGADSETNLSAHNQRTLERLALRMPIPDIIRLLTREREEADASAMKSSNLIGMALRLSPSVGMLGTIVGMIQLLSHLEDPSKIGSNMGLALLTTFYGLFFSIVLWTPLHQKLEALREADLHAYDQTLHWLELLEARKPAYYFSEAREARDEIQVGGP